MAGARRRGEGLGNARFLQADAAAFREAVGQGFDLVTSFDVVHDLTRPLETLKEIKAVLKEDGLFVMVDIRAETGEDKSGQAWHARKHARKHAGKHAGKHAAVRRRGQELGASHGALPLHGVFDALYAAGHE